ncbi:hypothetical protein FDA94_31530 [Herbidospora galbida]|uniref:Uncharacterized protein n=1 Tax=Herbidospora galbida TaxID=2575442 RepID=A0A4U3M773_9ACTN|nr:hypothetical protein [Herbidospora galbida]TKK84059.1 hypothetical protein FDA94_31530 [Herbidospora galbida]
MPSEQRGRKLLVTYLGGVGSGMVVNQLSDDFGWLGAGTVLLIVAVVWADVMLDERAPLSRALPDIVIYFVILVIALTAVVSQPLMVPSVVLAVALLISAALIIQDRLRAIISLVLISAFAMCLSGIGEALERPASVGRLIAIIYVGMHAAHVLLRLVMSNRLSRHGDPAVNQWRHDHSGPIVAVFILGIGGIVLGIAGPGDADLLVKIIALGAGVCLISASAVVVFLGRRRDIAGASLMAGGILVIALGFSSTAVLEREMPTFSIIFLLAVACLGVALTGGGLLLLQSAGVLARIRLWMVNLTKPAPPPT